MQTNETRHIARIKLVETKAKMSCMAEMSKPWSELKALSSTGLNSGSLFMPMLHGEPGLKSDIHNTGSLKGYWIGMMDRRTTLKNN